MSIFSWFFNLFHHKSTPPTPTINPMDYLWENNVNDELEERRIDFGGFQISDSLYVDKTHYIATWCYSPFGPYVPANGDGGEEYVINGDSVYISCTKDGSNPNTQYFSNNDWLLFKNDAIADWKETISGTGRYTRYCRQSIFFPILGTIDTIVCEHYDGTDEASSVQMERIFLGKGYGRLAWQAWTRNGPVQDTVKATPDFGWNILQGWVLSDTRVCVNPITTLPVNGNDLWNPTK